MAQDSSTIRLTYNRLRVPMLALEEIEMVRVMTVFDTSTRWLARHILTSDARGAYYSELKTTASRNHYTTRLIDQVEMVKALLQNALPNTYQSAAEFVATVLAKSSDTEIKRAFLSDIAYNAEGVVTTNYSQYLKDDKALTRYQNEERYASLHAANGGPHGRPPSFPRFGRHRHVFGARDAWDRQQQLNRMIQDKPNFVQSVVNSWWRPGAVAAPLLAPVTSPAPIETRIGLTVAAATTMSWSPVNSDDGSDGTPQ